MGRIMQFGSIWINLLQENRMEFSWYCHGFQFLCPDVVFLCGVVRKLQGSIVWKAQKFTGVIYEATSTVHVWKVVIVVATSFWLCLAMLLSAITCRSLHILSCSSMELCSPCVELLYFVSCPEWCMSSSFVLPYISIYIHINIYTYIRIFTCWQHPPC